MSSRPEKERGEKSERLERGDRERNSRSRRESKADNGEGEKAEKPEKVTVSRPGTAKPPAELVDVTPGKSFSRRCVLLTVASTAIFCIGLGAAIFYLIYYLAFEISFCPWTKTGTGCYQYFQDSKDWFDAQQLCRKRGGRLAELSGFDKQTDVVALYTRGGHSPSCFWIGGFESDPDEMLYTWNISGTVMNQYYIEWESGYPKNRSEATCVDFCHPDFSWKNKRCSLKQSYLCEFG